MLECSCFALQPATYLPRDIDRDRSVQAPSRSYSSYDPGFMSLHSLQLLVLALMSGKGTVA